MTERTLYDNTEYREAQKRYSAKVDRKHCVVCGRRLTGKSWKYCEEGSCKTYIFDTFYRPKDWRCLREIVLERDKQICQKCGRKAEKPEVDHIVALCCGGDMWNQENLQTLCQRCHHRKTRGDVRMAKLSPNQKKLC